MRRSVETVTDVPTKVIRVLLYLRVSTEDQARHGKSLPEQREEGMKKARTLAAEVGAELQIYEFEDHHGGDLLERPVLEEVRTFVRETRPDYFVCFDPDRFARSLKLQLIVADEIEDQGTRLVFVQQQYDPEDMMSRAFFQFRGLMAELDKAKILDRTSRGKRQKLRMGALPHGVLLYGYDYQKESGKLTVNEDEARWVRLMFLWAKDEGLGPEHIAQRLQTTEVPTKRGGQWRRGVVADMLKNTAYIGVLVANKYDFRGLDAQRRLPKERRTRKTTPKLRKESEWVRLDVPAIVPEQLFADVQRIRRNFKRQTQRGVGLLSGLAVCALCGGAMHYAPNRVGFLLRCSNRYPRQREHNGTVSPCTQRYQKAEPFEAFVYDMVGTWLTNADLLEQYAQERACTEPDHQPATRAIEAELSAVADQIRQKKDQQARVLYVVAKGTVHPEVAASQLAQVSAKITHLQDRETELLKRLSSLTRLAESSTGAQVETTVQQGRKARESPAARYAAEVREKMYRADGAIRRQLVRRILSAVLIHPEGICEPIPVGLS